MPPCSCIAVPITCTAPPHAYDFAIDAATPDPGSASASCVTAAVYKLAGDGNLDQHVGARVLDCLKRTDRTSELLAYPGVPHGRIQHGGAQAQAVAGKSDRRPVEQALPGGPGITGEPQQRPSKRAWGCSCVTGRITLSVGCLP
jgi:hypothetical protein